MAAATTIALAVGTAGFLKSSRAPLTASSPASTAGSPRNEIAPPRVSWQRAIRSEPIEPRFESPTRNPFAFPPTPAPPAEQSLAVGAPVLVVPGPAQQPQQVFTLIGIAENDLDEGVIRTAILTSDDGQLLMLRTGDHLTRGERISHIGADSVTLIDSRTASIRRLALQ